MKMVEVMKIHKPKLFLFIPDHARAAVVRWIIAVWAFRSVVRDSEHTAMFAVRPRQVYKLDVRTLDRIGHGTANAGHRVVVCVVEIVPSVLVFTVVIFHQGWVTQRPVPTLRPMRVFVRTVFPILGLLENLRGRYNIQRM